MPRDQIFTFKLTEKFFGPDGVERVPTQLFNGYGEFVAGLYEGLEKKALYM